MNEIVNKFLLGDKFGKPGFLYSACGPFTKKEYVNLKKLEIQDISIKMN